MRKLTNLFEAIKIVYTKEKQQHDTQFARYKILASLI